MHQSKFSWITVFLVLVMPNQYLNATEEYKNFYYDIIQMDLVSSSFITNALWLGVDNKELQYNGCHADLDEYRKAVYKKEDWALKMLDSSTQLQSGFLEGNVVDYGNTDECIKIIKNDDKNGLDEITGKMCYVMFGMVSYNKSMILDRYRVTLSACVPSSCERSEVQDILKNGIKFGVRFMVTECVTKETFSPPHDTVSYSIITFFIVLLTIIIVSTIYDVVRNECYNKLSHDDDTSPFLTAQLNKDVTKFKGILLSFSLYSNGKALLEEDTRDESIKALHGIRFFAACGVLSVHRILLDPQTFTNTFMFDKEVRKWYRMIQFNSYLWVDVFFLLSGLLISYNFLMKKDHKRKLNVWSFYLHRYLRLTPTLVAVILLNLLTDHMCSGPHCRYLIWLFQTRCEKNWWTSLLYINNIYDQLEMCVIQSWYLAADMQMYWCAPVLLYTLIRWQRFIFVELAVLFTLTTSYVFFISYKLGLLPTFIGTNEFFENDSKYVYNQFFGRAGPWLLGFGLGILLQRHREKPVKMSRLSVVFGWFRAIILCAAAMFGITPFIQEDYEHNPIVDSLFKAFYRNIWALGFAWIIYACYTGHGGWVNKFLSSYIFHPISRLTYSFYLIHIFGQFLTFQTAHVPRRYTDITQFSIVAGDIVIALILAVILHLAVEAPVLSLEKVLRSRKAIKEVEESKRRIVKEA